MFSDSDYDQFLGRLVDYVAEAKLDRFVIIFHGGEPLLAGVDRLVSYVRKTREAFGQSVIVDFGLQTNGLLLTEAALEAFVAEKIAVSLSLDGPQEVNDLHRTSRRGRSSFDQVQRALKLLLAQPSIFSGVISVVDPRVPPERYFDFFSQFPMPSLDFLLPDAHHLREPPHRQQEPEIYKNWLIRAFDLWIDLYPSIRIRTFESLLDALAGLPSGTDAFGYGDVTLITVETDGSYHDLDVLKIVSSEATKLSGSVRDTAIQDVAASTALQTHRRLLTKNGLSTECQNCSVVDICGGGSLPHRYGAAGFDQPSVYCEELKATIHHAATRMQQMLKDSTPSKIVGPLFDGDLGRFELAEKSCGSPPMQRLIEDAQSAYWLEFKQALAVARTSDGVAFRQHYRGRDELSQRQIASRPGTIAWQRAFRDHSRRVFSPGETGVFADESYLQLLGTIEPTIFSKQSVGLVDPWLRAPFSASIAFEPPGIVADGEPVLDEALELIRRWRPQVLAEMATICSAIQFVQDPLAPSDRIISFSDNAVPGALYVSIRQNGSLLDPFDLADSLIHEYRHQKLYLCERAIRFVEPTDTLVVSPWRVDLRPPSGLLHAAFVFVELRRFWLHVRENGPVHLLNRARNQVEVTDARLKEAWNTLDDCPLTDAGRSLVSVLRYAASQ